MATDADIDLAFTPAIEQAAMLRRREISSVELTELYLRRIDAINDDLGLFLTVVHEQALDAARVADQRLEEEPIGAPAFCGVPTSIKDLVDTAGIRTTHGTAAFADRVPDEDAEVARRIRGAGFVILGKTNTPEFGYAPITEPPAYAPARNPWNPEHTTGGSSGGAAGSVAAGLSAVAHASDGGGSVRVPSSLCGDVGIKPSRGRITRAPAPQHPFATDGPIARTVADAAALLDVMEGPGVGDAYWAPPLERPLTEEVGRPPGTLRIAWTDEPFIDGVVTEPGHREALADAVTLLEGLGHVVEQGRPFWDAGITAQTVALFAAEGASRPDLPPMDTLDPPTRMLLESAELFSATDIAAAERQLALNCRRTVSFFDDVDVLVTPTLPITAPKVGEFSEGALEAEGVMKYSALAGFTSTWNMTGQPAITLPLAVDDGLPVGIQFVGRPADEATLVRLATEVEKAAPWADRRPTIAS